MARHFYCPSSLLFAHEPSGAYLMTCPVSVKMPPRQHSSVPIILWNGYYPSNVLFHSVVCETIRVPLSQNGGPWPSTTRTKHRYITRSTPLPLIALQLPLISACFEHSTHMLPQQQLCYPTCVRLAFMEYRCGLCAPDDSVTTLTGPLYSPGSPLTLPIPSSHIMLTISTEQFRIPKSESSTAQYSKSRSNGPTVRRPKFDLRPKPSSEAPPSATKAAPHSAHPPRPRSRAHQRPQP